MKSSNKKNKQEDELVDKTLLSEQDEMEKIRTFIRKKQLENQILKKLTDDMMVKPEDNPGKMKKTKSI